MAGKTLRDLVWNYASVFILAVSGLVFSLIIALYYDASVLGVFNKTYAWYIVLSQLTVWGLQAAVLKYASEYYQEKETLESILTSALLVVTVISFVLCGLFLEISNIIVRDSAFRSAMKCAIIALPFFSYNKVILGYLNGITKMQAYAFFQAIRCILIAVAVVALAMANVAGAYLTLCFVIAEVVTLVLSVVYLLRSRCFVFQARWKDITEWGKKQFLFGIRILPANMVLELNTRVDVICLGLLQISDEQIGIYSFALLFAEGFYQVMVVLRKMINPRLAREYHEGRLKVYIQQIRQENGKLLNILMWCGYALLLGGYYIMCRIMGRTEYVGGIVYAAIICLAIVLSYRCIIVGNIFNQTGMPEKESQINICTVLSNCVLNLMLIPFMGTYGAALATGMSYIMFSVYLRKLVWKVFNITV